MLDAACRWDLFPIPTLVFLGFLIRNYWKYLKAKLKKENSELVSATTQLKFLEQVPAWHFCKVCL